MFAAAAGRLTASPCPVMPVLPAAPAAAHQCAIARTLLVFCLLAGFAAAETAAQLPHLSSLQPEAARELSVQLVQAELYRDGISGIDGLRGIRETAVSADGSLLFVTSQGDDALSVWRVNAETGALTQSALYLDDDGAAGLPEGVTGEFDGLNGTRNVALSPDGSLLFITALFDSTLSVWQVNAEAGTLTQSALYRNGNGIDGLLFPNSLVVSPDGSLLFVTSLGAAALSVWEVNAEAGTLTQTAVYRDDSRGGNFNGLDNPAGLALSPDGSLLFVTATIDDALTVWRVDAAQGSLEQTQLLVDGSSGIDGLNSAEGLALNADGSLLFVTAISDDALSVWEVNTEAGTLTQSALYRNGMPFDGLEGAQGLAINTDGSLLFVTASVDDALTVWRVDAAQGSLEQTQLLVDGSSGIDGLNGASAVTPSPDSSLLFVAAQAANSLGVWHIIRRVLPTEQLMLRARISTARSENTTLVITARQDDQVIEKEAALPAGETSATAVFAAGTLGPGNWFFEVTATRPPDVLTNLESVRTRVQVVQPPPVTLALTLPEMPLVQGAMFTVTVAAAPAPMTELNVQVSLTGEGVMEVMQTATLTMENPSQALTFTVPADAPETLQLATQTTVEDVLLAAVTEATATVTAVPIQLFDFVQPEGTVNTDDLIFALRYLMLCADGCSDEAEMQALTVNLPPLRRGIDPATINIESTLSAVTGDSAGAQSIVILLQYLSGISGNLLLPGEDESARQDALEAVREILDRAQQEE